MKKTLWTFIMGMMLIFTSCQNEEDFTGTRSIEVAKSDRFYGVRQIEDGASTRGVAQMNKLWYNGTTISVKFLNDPYNMAEKIKTYAAEWEQYANIKFDFVASGNADVRIGFDWNDSKWVTWSYTGSDCKYVNDQSEATVNFALWDGISETEKRADVLRAFGQVLGLELEHRHLSFDAGWTSKISEYWEGEIEDIPWDELKQYVFDPLSGANIVQTEEYDENSIMIWPFVRKYATNTARDYNYELSAKDIEFIKQLYPKAEEQLVFAMKPSAHWNSGTAHAVQLILYKEGEYRIEYEDGTNYIFNGDANNPIRLPGIQKPSKLYGDPYNIKVITQTKQMGDGVLYSWEITEMDNCKNLVKFYGDLGSLRSYDFSLLPKLEVLCVSGFYITEVDINRLSNLKSLYIGGVAMDSDISTLSNPKLESLTLHLTNLKNAEVQNLPNLLSLNISSYNIQQLDLSKNTLLETLSLKIYSEANVDLSKNANLKSLTVTNRTKSINLSNNSNLTSIHLSDACYFNLDTAAEFANNLPTVLQGTIRASSTSNISSVKSICESKGWTVQ